MSSLPKLITITALTKVGKGATLEALRSLLPDHAQADCSDVARQWAREKGFPVFEDFVRAITADPSMFPDYDEQIDGQTLERLKSLPLVITGRLPHYMASRAGLEAFKVSLYCPLSVRAKRAVADGIDPDKLLRRDKDDNARYRARFGFTLPVAVGSKPHQVHLAICTRDFTPREVAERIVECARCWQSGWSFVPNHHIGQS